MIRQTICFALCALPVLPALGASCESLAGLSLPQTTITLAQPVGAGEFVPLQTGGRGRGAGGNPYKDLPAFCHVAATLKPTSDSNIKIEVWLPAEGWNGNFLAAGNGGGAGAALQGSINIPALAAALRRGYATAATDTGHDGATLSFAIDHPEQLIDFGYRAVHETTVRAKSIAAAFYGDGPQLSYWNGCAAAGRQGLMEAQRFPADYDGVVVAAAANNWIDLQSWSLSVYEATHKDEASYIPPAKYPLIHKAALDQCDALDGVKDGVIENPLRCKFDPKVLECKGADTSACLTAPQVEAARKIYAPLLNSRTKSEIFPGLEPGSELGWAGLADGDEPGLYIRETFKYVIFRDPKWDYKTHPVNFDTDVPMAEKLDNGTVSATDANLRPFFARGGKMILYHGWTDPLIAPADAVNYYKRVEDTVGGAAKIKDSMRLYMVPGMNHCRGGEGPDDFDMQPVMEQWREKGKAPDQVIAAKIVNGKTERTRPLCPWPQVAVYKGSGNTDEAANFVCK